MHLSHTHSPSGFVRSKQTNYKGRRKKRRELALGHWPTATARKDLVRPNLKVLKSVLVPGRDSPHKLKGNSSKWMTSRGGKKMQKVGETGHWWYSGEGEEQRGKFWGPAGQSPTKSEETQPLSLTTHIHTKKEKKSTRVPECCFTKRSRHC